MASLVPINDPFVVGVCTTAASTTSGLTGPSAVTEQIVGPTVETKLMAEWFGDDGILRVCAGNCENWIDSISMYA